MAPDIIKVEPAGGWLLRLTFEDGLTSEVNFGPHFQGKGGLCADLQDPAYFAKAKVDSDLHTIVWPNGYDIDPEVLYSWATGKPLGTATPIESR